VCTETNSCSSSTLLGTLLFASHPPEKWPKKKHLPLCSSIFW
jgi:hypothetical protein